MISHEEIFQVLQESDKYYKGEIETVRGPLYKDYRESYAVFNVDGKKVKISWKSVARHEKLICKNKFKNINFNHPELLEALKKALEKEWNHKCIVTAKVEIITNHTFIFSIQERGRRTYLPFNYFIINMR